MKTKIFLSVILFTTILSACKKHEIFGTESSKEIVGTWTWKSNSGGWSGDETPSSTNQNIVLNFSSDGKYTKTVNGIVTQVGYFYIAEKNHEDNTSGMYLIVSNKKNELEKHKIFESWINLNLSADTLISYTGGDDGITSIYYKVK